MPLYTYRREDGTTFEIRQRFADEALRACPTTGQQVERVIQLPGIVFRGSGFYVNDSKKAANGRKKAADKKPAADKTKAGDTPKSEKPSADKAGSPAGEKAAASQG